MKGNELRKWYVMVRKTFKLMLKMEQLLMIKSSLCPRRKVVLFSEV